MAINPYEQLQQANWGGKPLNSRTNAVTGPTIDAFQRPTEGRLTGARAQGGANNATASVSGPNYGNQQVASPLLGGGGKRAGAFGAGHGKGTKGDGSGNTFHGDVSIVAGHNLGNVGSGGQSGSYGNNSRAGVGNDNSGMNVTGGGDPNGGAPDAPGTPRATRTPRTPAKSRGGTKAIGTPAAPKALGPGSAVPKAAKTAGPKSPAPLGDAPKPGESKQEPTQNASSPKPPFSGGKAQSPVGSIGPVGLMGGGDKEQQSKNFQGLQSAVKTSSRIGGATESSAEKGNSGPSSQAAKTADALNKNKNNTAKPAEPTNPSAGPKAPTPWKRTTEPVGDGTIGPRTNLDGSEDKRRYTTGAIKSPEGTGKGVTPSAIQPAGPKGAIKEAAKKKVTEVVSNPPKNPSARKKKSNTKE